MSKYFKTTFLNTVKPTKERFLWFPYFPQNAMTLLTGTGGSGKSFFALDSACKMILGQALGNGLKGSLGNKNVAYLSTEENKDNALDRIKQLYNEELANKIIQRIAFINPKTNMILNVSDSGMLNDFFQEMKEINIGLIIFDPLTSYMGTNRNNASGIREAFEMLNTKLAENNITGVGIGHLTKPTSKSAEFRVMGSTEWISCVRSSLMMAVDVLEPSITYVSINKGNNVAEEEKARVLAYSKSLGKGRGLEFNDDLIGDDFDFSDHLRGRTPKAKKWEQAVNMIVSILSEEKWKDGIYIGNRNAKNPPKNTIFGQLKSRNRADLIRQGQKAIGELEAKGLIEKISVRVPRSTAQIKKLKANKKTKNFQEFTSRIMIRIPVGKMSKVLELELSKILKRKAEEDSKKD